MNTELDTRLAAAEALANEQNQKLHRSFNVTAIIYIVLVLVVIAYTSWIYGALERETTPEAMAEHLGLMAAVQLPELRHRVVSELNANAEEYAAKTVTALIDEIPKVESTLKNALDARAEIAARQVREQSYEGFLLFADAHGQEIRDALKDVPADEAAIAIAEMFVETIDEELGKYINDRMVYDLNELRDNIAMLARPSGQLTKAEDAKRRVIMTWAWLNERPELDTSTLQVLFGEMQQRYEWLRLPEELLIELDAD